MNGSANRPRRASAVSPPASHTPRITVQTSARPAARSGRVGGRRRRAAAASPRRGREGLVLPEANWPAGLHTVLAQVAARRLHDRGAVRRAAPVGVERAVGAGRVRAHERAQRAGCGAVARQRRRAQHITLRRHRPGESSPGLSVAHFWARAQET